MTYEQAVAFTPWVFGLAALVCFAVGYWHGEQTAYRSLDYGSERPFSSLRYWFRAWFPR